MLPLDRRRWLGSRALVRLLVVAVVVVAVGASLQAGAAVGREVEGRGVAEGSLRTERDAFAATWTTAPARTSVSLRSVPALAVLSAVLVGLAARWCRPRRPVLRSAPLPARRFQVPRGPPTLAVV